MPSAAIQLPKPHPITVREYLRMGETGVLDPEARTELIEGELFDIPPIGPQHSSRVKRFIRLFSESVGKMAIVSAQDPVLLGDFSAPQPDLALLRWRDDFYEEAHPGPQDIILIVEVADTTLAHDRNRKLPIYARFAVPEVWLVDVAGKHLDVYRESEDGAYTTRFRLQDLADVGIAALPGVQLELRSLF